MGNKEFAVFIPTHERADNVITLSTLKRIGYTGEVFLRTNWKNALPKILSDKYKKVK